MKSGHILVVDDQIELAENIAEVLQGIGFETEVAGSAEAGLDWIARGGITAVVTDYKLPGKTGAQLIEELRQRGVRIPVLMMSAYTDEMTMERAREAGAWLFLPKPVPLPTLINAFESLARRPATTLLVDDEDQLAQNLAEALTAAGHDVVVGHSVAEALSHNRRLQTAVLDYRLPDGTGLDVARELRARDPSIDILFISGYTGDLEQADGKTLAGVETLEKPVETGKVLSWVQLALEKTRP